MENLKKRLPRRAGHVLSHEGCDISQISSFEDLTGAEPLIRRLSKFLTFLFCCLKFFFKFFSRRLSRDRVCLVLTGNERYFSFLIRDFGLVEKKKMKKMHVVRLGRDYFFLGFFEDCVIFSTTHLQFFTIQFDWLSLLSHFKMG